MYARCPCFNSWHHTASQAPLGKPHTKDKQKKIFFLPMQRHYLNLLRLLGVIFYSKVSCCLMLTTWGCSSSLPPAPAPLSSALQPLLGHRVGFERPFVLLLSSTDCWKSRPPTPKVKESPREAGQSQTLHSSLQEKREHSRHCVQLQSTSGHSVRTLLGSRPGEARATPMGSLELFHTPDPTNLKHDILLWTNGL